MACIRSVPEGAIRIIKDLSTSIDPDLNYQTKTIHVVQIENGNITQRNIRIKDAYANATDEQLIENLKNKYCINSGKEDILLNGVSLVYNKQQQKASISTKAVTMPANTNEDKKYLIL